MLTFGRGEEDDMLWMDTQPLFSVVPRVQPTELHILRAMGRLVAEAFDSIQGHGGFTALQRKEAFGSFRGALAILVACGSQVHVLPKKADLRAGLYPGRDHDIWHVKVAMPWSLATLSDMATVSGVTCYAQPADTPQQAQAPQQHERWGYVISVRGGVSLPTHLVPDPSTAWKQVVATPEMAVCVARETLSSLGQRYAVRLYRCGILWSEQEADVQGDATLAGACLHINVTTRTHLADSVEGYDAWIPDFPADVPMCEQTQGSSVLGAAVLHAKHAHAWGQLAIVRALARVALPWRAALRLQWQYEEERELVDAMGNAAVSDELSALMDSRVLLRHSRRDPCIEPTMRAYDLQHGGGVDFLATMPVSRTRFTTLHLVGATEALDDACACSHGILWKDGGARIIAVPEDANAASITMAMTELLHSEAALPESPDKVHVPFETVHSERASAVQRFEHLFPYAVQLASDGIWLTRDASAASHLGYEATSVDDVTFQHGLPQDKAFRRRIELWRAFPKLVRRLRMQGNRPEACLAEAQTRRVVSNWTLEAFESGENMSSLGLSILVCLCLTSWLGARARIFMSRTHAAVVGYWAVDATDYTLFDPTRTMRNSFHLAGTLMHALPESGGITSICRDTMVEVRGKHKWRAARVLSVNTSQQTMTVRFFYNGTSQQIRVNERGWRVAVRSADSDVDDVIRRLVHSSSLGSSASFSGDAHVP